MASKSEPTDVLPHPAHSLLAVLEQAPIRERLADAIAEYLFGEEEPAEGRDDDVATGYFRQLVPQPASKMHDEIRSELLAQQKLFGHVRRDTQFVYDNSLFNSIGMRRCRSRAGELWLERLAWPEDIEDALLKDGVLDEILDQLQKPWIVTREDLAECIRTSAVHDPSLATARSLVPSVEWCEKHCGTTRHGTPQSVTLLPPASRACGAAVQHMSPEGNRQTKAAPQWFKVFDLRNLYSLEVSVDGGALAGRVSGPATARAIEPEGRYRVPLVIQLVRVFLESRMLAATERDKSHTLSGAVAVDLLTKAIGRAGAIYQYLQRKDAVSILEPDRIGWGLVALHEACTSSWPRIRLAMCLSSLEAIVGKCKPPQDGEVPRLHATGTAGNQAVPWPAGINQAVKQRVAVLLTDDPERRRQIAGQVAKLYDHRSKAVHADPLSVDVPAYAKVANVLSLAAWYEAMYFNEVMIGEFGDGEAVNKDTWYKLLDTAWTTENPLAYRSWNDSDHPSLTPIAEQSLAKLVILDTKQFAKKHRDTKSFEW